MNRTGLEGWGGGTGSKLFQGTGDLIKPFDSEPGNL